jgi:acyl carrier protein
MTPDDIISLLSDITRRPPAAFPPDEPFDIDSLDRLELAMAVEDRWRVEVPDHVAQAWRTPADAARYAVSAAAARASKAATAASKAAS